MLTELNIDDLVKLKKTHPCGSFTWKVTRLGANIGLKCQGCGHYLLFPRSKLERIMKGAPTANS
ncbi:MAG: DUF951 domain-containing protein [Dehalococcoidia bacterium]|nr:DUF951 domain-containing protein [Dehalococcoidia bacterium]